MKRNNINDNKYIQAYHYYIRCKTLTYTNICTDYYTKFYPCK